MLAEGAYDILIGSAGLSNDLTVEGNSITVGSNVGIELQTYAVDGTIIKGNTITGSSASVVGIDIGTFTGGETPTIDDNAISGLSNGSGIATGSDAVIKNNTISSNKWGIKVTAGVPTVGSASGNTNTITSNTTGVLADGGTADPVIRKNSIQSNTYGVVAKASADPDVGTSSADGDNNISNNSTYCIWNRNRNGLPQVKAHGNYYGTCSGGTPSICWSGNVDTGTSLCSNPLGYRIPSVPVTEPIGFRLLGARPNPMSGSGLIYFSLDAGYAAVDVQVFDVTGRLVYDFGTLDVGPGEHHVHWDGRDKAGRSVMSGVYFVRVASEGQFQATTKVLVAR